jgi:hypothetical protein
MGATGINQPCNVNENFGRSLSFIIFNNPEASKIIAFRAVELPA